MSNVVLLFLCLAAGVALRASGRVPDNAHLAINVSMGSQRSMFSSTLTAISLP